MEKSILTLACVVTFFALNTASADAATKETLRVGLRYGSSAMFSANLENAVGSGYELGYFEDGRDFVSLGWTDETSISMTAAVQYMSAPLGNIPRRGMDPSGPWHVELDEYDDFEEAEDAAREADGWTVFLDGTYAGAHGVLRFKKRGQSGGGRSGRQGGALL